jgi:hypothetical protein
MLAETPDKGRQVCKMAKRDLGSDCEVLEAVRLDGPGRVTSEDLSDPSLLSAGEHGAAIVAEGRCGG